MGYTSDFLAHVEITPALNEAEVYYLDAFRRSARFDRPGGPYEVPANPYAHDEAVGGREAYNRPAPGQPQLWCQWQPCWSGCCLSFDGNEKFYEPVRWMRYLIDHLLRPGAQAAGSGLACFGNFTFDHRLEGVVIGCRRDNKQLLAIRVHDNEVTTVSLREQDPRLTDFPPLP